MHVVLPQKMDLITVDVAWTKQYRVLPNVFKNLKENGRVISLIKPHYEAERGELKKGRVEDEYMDAVLERVKSDIVAVEGEVLGLIESPIVGEKGKNREFLALIKKG
jgi:23S rRNA (cytidine1920-2'-O)/16S rRNA (cytidine1409-2'-O)-methyltransferase